MDIFEITALVAGAAAVLLISRQIVWGWPLGIINAITLAVVYWKSDMYANFFLQMIFLLISSFGWWSWGRKKNKIKQNVIRKIKHPELISYFFLAVALTFPIWLFIAKFTEANIDPFLLFFDSITTSFSIVAQYMLARKFLQNWLMWIFADIMYIPVCAINGLYLVSIFYIITFTISIKAYIDWKRKLNPAIAN